MALASVDIFKGERERQTVTTEKLIEVAKVHVEETLKDFKEERKTTLELVKKPRPIDVPKGELTFDVNIPNGLRYSSPIPVYVSIIVDNSPVRRAIVYYKVHVFQDVIVAAKHLQPGRKLEASDFRIEEREIGNFRGKYLTKLADVVGREVNRLVREGRIILEPMVEYPVVIESGNQVDIIARLRGVEVKTKGIALQRGRTLDIIRVRNALTKKVLHAKVIDEKTVEVV